MKALPVQPLVSLRHQATAIFGGVVDPSKLRFPFSRMGASDARDWDAVRAWSNEVAALFAKDLEPVSA